MEKTKRELIDLDEQLVRLIAECWCCRKCSTRGIATNMAAYRKNGVNCVEAKCLRCGMITRYPVNDLND